MQRGVGDLEERAPDGALLHVTYGVQGPDRRGAIEGLEGVVSGHVRACGLRAAVSIW